MDLEIIDHWNGVHRDQVLEYLEEGDLAWTPVSVPHRSLDPFGEASPRTFVICAK
jgi:hypothetical protein